MKTIERYKIRGMIKKSGKHKKKRALRNNTDKMRLVFSGGYKATTFLVSIFLAKNIFKLGRYYSIEEILSFSFGSSIMIMAALILLVEITHEYH